MTVTKNIKVMYRIAPRRRCTLPMGEYIREMVSLLRAQR